MIYYNLYIMLNIPIIKRKNLCFVGLLENSNFSKFFRNKGILIKKSSVDISLDIFDKAIIDFIILSFVKIDKD